ncbi:hypothetical protein MFIFM68171_02005 [Madurella fahalii]|uniref:Uncharacterized protein n=1 Tax=Madurella fahalii TaxID=1157608 RepID=A0ABQ0G219_9PEZI
MCHVSRKVYTVCAHGKAGETRECEAQNDRKERWGFLETTGFCVGFDLLRCRRYGETTEVVYGFCRECRDFYRGFNTRDVNAILNYWAYKNRHGYSTSVSAKLISADEVFGRPPPALEAVNRARCELVALGRELPCSDLETPIDWLQRLEKIRRSTLDWARQSSSVQMPRCIAFDESVLSVQPRRASPMSAYPHLRGLSSPQVNFETLYKLCGDIPREFVDGQDNPVSHTPPVTMRVPPTRLLLPAQMNGSEESNKVGNNETPRSQDVGHSDISTPSYISGPIGHPLTELSGYRDIGDSSNSRPRQPGPLASPYTDDGEDETESLFDPLDGIIDIYLSERQEIPSKGTEPSQPQLPSRFSFDSSVADSDEDGGDLSTVDLIDRLPQEQEEQWQRATLTGKVRKAPSSPPVFASHFSLGSSLADSTGDQDPEEPQKYYHHHHDHHHHHHHHHGEESNTTKTTTCCPISDDDSDADEPHDHPDPAVPPTSHFSFSFSDISDIGPGDDAKEDQGGRDATVGRPSELRTPPDDGGSSRRGSRGGRDVGVVVRPPFPLRPPPRPARPTRPRHPSGSEAVSSRIAGGCGFAETPGDGGWI